MYNSEANLSKLQVSECYAYCITKDNESLLLRVHHDFYYPTDDRGALIPTNPNNNNNSCCSSSSSNSNKRNGKIRKSKMFLHNRWSMCFHSEDSDENDGTKKSNSNANLMTRHPQSLHHRRFILHERTWG